MLDLQRLNDDWQTAAVKEAVRRCKAERYYDAFLKRLKLLEFGKMECFQDIFHEAARLHIQQMTTTSDKQVIGAYRVLTSVLIGYQTADAIGYKTWVTELVNSEGADAKKMLYALLTHHELSPAYYMLGWQFVHTRKTLQEAYGSSISCTGSRERGGDCIIAHEHATVTETNCASTGWTFLIEASEPVKVAVGVHVKHRAGVTHRTYMGDGGKPTAMQLDESGNKPEGVNAEFAKLCLGERENPVSAKVREGFEETGSLIQPSRWRLSWLGTGTIGKAWQLFDFSTFLTATDKMTHKQEPFADCEEFESSMWATHEDIMLIEKENHPDFDLDVAAEREHTKAGTHLLSRRIELGARAAGVPWPGSLKSIELPTVTAIEPEAAAPQEKQRRSISAPPKTEKEKLRRKEGEQTRPRDWLATNHPESAINPNTRRAAATTTTPRWQGQPQ